VDAGSHQLVVRMRETDRAEGFDQEKTASVTLSPQQNLVIDFRPELGGFLFL